MACQDIIIALHACNTHGNEVNATLKPINLWQTFREGDERLKTFHFILEKKIKIINSKYI